MKLDPLTKLMATLATAITRNQRDEMLSQSVFNEWERDNITSSVSMLFTLKKKCNSNAEFLDQLGEMLAEANRKDLAQAVCEFRDKNKDALESMTSRYHPPNGAYIHKPSPQQKKDFKTYLLRISHSLQHKDLEILRDLSPIPDGRKDGIRVGFKLFEALQTHGYISENDVELLDDLFTHIKLRRPCEILRDYQKKHPSVHYGPPPPSAPMRHVSDPGQPPQHTSSQQYSYSPSISLPTGHTFTVNPGCHPIQETTSHFSPSPRPPGLCYRPDPTYPRPSNSPPIIAHPNTEEHSSVNTSSQPVDTRRGRDYNLSITPFQPELSDIRPPPMNPNFTQPFCRQTSPATPPVTAAATPFPSAPSSLDQAAVTSPLSAAHSIHIPPLHQSAISPHHTLQSSPSVPEAATFPEAQSCQSQGERARIVSLPSRHMHATPEAAGSIPSSQTATSSHGYGRESQSLPSVRQGRDKLLGKHSREMDQVPSSEPAKKVMCGSQKDVDRHCSEPRNVFTQQDIRRVVGSPQDASLQSINHPMPSESVPNQCHVPATQPGTQARTLAMEPGPSALAQSNNSQQPCSISEPTHPEDPDSHNYHFLTPSPISKHPSQNSSHCSLVSGISVSPLATNSWRGSSYSDLTNPPNSFTSQLVSHNSSYGSFRSHLSPQSQPTHSVSSSHEPSTQSLVKRQLLQQEDSNSFASLPEEEGEGQDRESDDDSSDDDTAPSPRKHSRGAPASSESSSSSSEGEEIETSEAKRSRTEEHNRPVGIAGRIVSTFKSLPLINRLYKGRPKEVDDSESEHFVDAQS